VVKVTKAETVQDIIVRVR